MRAQLWERHIPCHVSFHDNLNDGADYWNGSIGRGSKASAFAICGKQRSPLDANAEHENLEQLGRNC